LSDHLPARDLRVVSGVPARVCALRAPISLAFDSLGDRGREIVGARLPDDPARRASKRRYEVRRKRPLV
jgi:hypothetical protein